MQHNNRKQKIQFLKGLSEGTRNISELSEQTTYYFAKGTKHPLAWLSDKRYSPERMEKIKAKKAAFITLSDGSFIDIS